MHHFAPPHSPREYPGPIHGQIGGRSLRCGTAICGAGEDFVEHPVFSTTSSSSAPNPAGPNLKLLFLTSDNALDRRGVARTNDSTLGSKKVDTRGRYTPWSILVKLGHWTNWVIGKQRKYSQNIPRTAPEHPQNRTEQPQMCVCE